METATSANKVEACEPVIGKAEDNTDVLTSVGSWPASANTYVHHVKGRLRVQAIVLRDTAEMQALRQHLGAIHGVRKVACNPIIGSITVEYGPELEFPVLLGSLQSAHIEISALPAVPNRNVSAAYSPWRKFFAAGLAAHLVLDLLAWGFAGAALMR
jgi:hypothetical protein